MRIHREGVKILITTFFILLTLVVLGWILFGFVGVILLAISLPFYIFVLRFFRVPKRPVNENPNAVLSPCDGKVVVIEEVDESEFLNTRCLQVSVFMSVWNVHINWYPIAGNVLYQKYHPGEFLLAWEPKSSTLNERTTVVVEHPAGAKVLFRQIAGYLARRIVCYTKAEDAAQQGQEMGFIKFGSRVDLFLPLDSTIKVELNQKVVGRQTEIAILPKA
ncbi:MAG: phosphatidylserine decarboxylase family protein [Tenuifilaceae bacterium]|jgi:phosphatidylserine decarboxylase|nr:phosphatidylserine decarboxylase family protein [Tenuifilaceae bacterium]